MTTGPLSFDRVETATAEGGQRGLSRRALVALVAVAGLVIAVAAVTVSHTAPATPVPSTRPPVTRPDLLPILPPQDRGVVVAPAGFGLALLDLHTLTTQLIPGPEGGGSLCELLPSPDRQRLAVRSSGRGVLYLVDGATTLLSLGEGINTPAWSPESNGFVTTGADGGLVVVGLDRSVRGQPLSLSADTQATRLEWVDGTVVIGDRIVAEPGVLGLAGSRADPRLFVRFPLGIRVLGADPRGDSFALSWEDDLRLAARSEVLGTAVADQARHPVGRLLQPGLKPLSAAAWSPAGVMMAVIGFDGQGVSLWLFDTIRGIGQAVAPLGALTLSGRPPPSFSADGRWVIVRGAQDVVAYDLLDKKAYRVPGLPEVAPGNTACAGAVWLHGLPRADDNPVPGPAVLAPMAPAARPVVSIRGAGALAAGPRGELAVSTFDGEGSTIDILGGPSAGRFAFPGWAAAMAYAPDGALYVANRYSNEVVKVGPGGVTQTIVGPDEIFIPLGLAVAPDGQVLVADGHRRIARVGADGTVTTVVDGITADSLAVAPDGTIYAAASSEAGPGPRQITVIASDGRQTRVAGVPPGLGAIEVAVSPGGRLWAATMDWPDYDEGAPTDDPDTPRGGLFTALPGERLQPVTTTGVGRGFLRTGPLAALDVVSNSVAFAPDGTLYFTQYDGVVAVGPDVP